MKRRFRRLKHYFIPHAGNKFKPGLFAKESVAVLALALILVEGAYFFGTNVLLQNEGFTAAVLPAALTDLTNADRAASGHLALTHDPVLARAAQKKAEDMAAKGYFAHVSPEGKTPWYWLEAVGYNYTYAGENLAVDFTDSIDVEEGWMSSPAHYANIVKSEYTQIGIGTAQGVYQGKETTFVVEFFAALPNETEISKKTGNAETPKKAAVAAALPVAAPSPIEETRVLGAQAEAPSPIRPTLATVASSPNPVVPGIFGIFAAAIAFLLALAIFAKMRIHYLEAAGGAMLIALALALVFFNVIRIPEVQIPHDSQAASVYLSL